MRKENSTLQSLTEEIINGKRLSRNDNLIFFKTADLNELCNCADKLRQHFVGDNVYLCTIINGRSLDGEDFDKAIKVYKKLNEKVRIHLCASMGFLRKEQLQALKNAGVTSYHHNIETPKRFFPSICTTHTYEMKIQTIKLAQEIGLHVCSGGIIGMGETFEDRIDMALSLAELNIESIPINALMPITGNMLTTSGNN